MPDSSGGWIRLYRAIREHPLWERPASRLQAWLDLRLEAVWQEQEVLKGDTSLVLRPGELVLSLKDMRDRWGWTRNQVRYFLDQAKAEGRLEKVADEGRAGTRWRVFTPSESDADSHSAVAADSHSETLGAQQLPADQSHSAAAADSHPTHTDNHTDNHISDSHSETLGAQRLPADHSRGCDTRDFTQIVTHQEGGEGEEVEEEEKTPTPPTPRPAVVVEEVLKRKGRQWRLAPPRSELKRRADELRLMAEGRLTDDGLARWIDEQPARHPDRPSGEMPATLGVLRDRLADHLDRLKAIGGNGASPAAAATEPADSAASGGAKPKRPYMKHDCRRCYDEGRAGTVMPADWVKGIRLCESCLRADADAEAGSGAP